jgi:hypothetical protein
MSRLRRDKRMLVGFIVVLAVAAAAVFGVVRTAGESEAEHLVGWALKEEGAEEQEHEQSEAKPSASNEGLGEAADATVEAYKARAYPAADIPFSATVNALSSWKGLKAKGKGKNTPGQWTLAGPSSANYPAVLTFSGADYTASGRVTALAIDPNCSTGKCRVWVGAAGGGIWRTDNALSGNGTKWDFVSSSFGTNAIGTLTYHDGVLYAGTGEPNASGDSEAGLGIFKSTDGGETWIHLSSQVTNLTTSSCGASNATGGCTAPVANGTYTGDAFAGRSISAIVVDPNNANSLYVSSTRGVRGISSVTGGTSSNPPTPRPPFGLFKSSDGGATFSFVWDGNQSVRGVNDVELDPSSASTVYAAAFQQGVWRSTNGGTSFSRIYAPLNPANNTDRAEFAVTTKSGKTRMFVGDGAQGDQFTGSPPVQTGFAARLYRTDDAAAAVPSFADLTTSQDRDYCTAQCWYDNVVYSPPGKPDVVYLGGSYSYGSYGHTTNGRAFIRSGDAGVAFADMTWDATTGARPPANCCQPNAISPNGQHPDSHAIVEIPGTDAAIFGTDGGLMRSNGSFTDVSSQCSSRDLSGADLALCQQLLSAVPDRLFELNKSLATLQFQSLSVAPDNPKHVQGGTQDNGTFETHGSAVVWPQIIYGDGGQSGFNVSNSKLRFNSYFGQFHDANFRDGDPTKWVIISGKIASSPEGSNFYAPIVADPNPARAGSIFEGSQSVWRTQEWGGDQAFLEANCPEFTTSGANPNCGDFERIGPSGATDLTANASDYRGGASRAGGFVAAVERAASDTGTMWVATTTGRVFISKNANDAAGSVTYTRLDTLPSATADPQRFVSGITIDPANPNHAWISYSGYNFNTPSQPGHVFEVAYNGSNDATWTSLDGSGATSFPDFPATDIARDTNGDLYVSNDFGVLTRAHGTTTWAVAGEGLPMVEVPGLTIVPGARKLYAATHGLSAWQLTLP